MLFVRIAPNFPNCFGKTQRGRKRMRLAETRPTSDIVAKTWYVLWTAGRGFGSAAAASGTGVMADGRSDGAAASDGRRPNEYRQHNAAATITTSRLYMIVPRKPLHTDDDGRTSTVFLLTALGIPAASELRLPSSPPGRIKPTAVGCIFKFKTLFQSNRFARRFYELVVATIIRRVVRSTSRSFPTESAPPNWYGAHECSTLNTWRFPRSTIKYKGFGFK